MAAASDLEEISNYLRLHYPSSRLRLSCAFTTHRSHSSGSLNAAGPERLNGTRELVLAPLPYLILYSVRDDSVNVLRILHGAQERLFESE